VGSGSSGTRRNLIVDAGDGLALNVNVSGDGAPLIVLHGFTGSSETWADLGSRIGARCMMIAVDLPGHGMSTSPMGPERYDLNRLSDDLARVMDAIQIESATILGYSMGGRAALRMALNRPERVDALILESTSPGIEDDAEREARTRSDNELAEFIEREGVEAFVNRWETLSLWETQRSLSLEARAELRRQRLGGNQAGLAGSLRGAGAGAGESVAMRLKEIGAQSLLIAGELDSKYTVIMRAMHQAMSGSRIVIVKDAGHAVHLERPDEFASLVGDFVHEVNRM
jgi:2-succinyl-6-hydroxy-2,4-cyclohexadiene-1-carboxylate synthase